MIVLKNAMGTYLLTVTIKFGLKKKKEVPSKDRL